MVTDPHFKKIIDHVNNNHTGLNILDPHFNSILIVGRVGESILNQVSIEVIEMGWYQCITDISYNGYDDEFTTVFQPVKIVKTEEEVINLIDKSISISDKLMKTVHQLEKELED